MATQSLVGTSTGKSVTAGRFPVRNSTAVIEAPDVVTLYATNLAHDITNTASLNSPKFLGLTAGAIFGPW